LHLDISGSRFIDEHGRTVILRGINLGGGTKTPSRPNGATHHGEGFFDTRGVSFVGRPFPLEEADEHFRRLRSWGFTFLRFVVTWEAIEHAGPGIYDDAYLEYVLALVRKAQEHQLAMYIDPHQDVWSRFTGGDGAPAWTLEAVGMEPARMHETGAAILHQLYGDPFPRMVWPTNVTKLGASTMFTLFFAGNDFAPHTSVDGEPVQEYLQRHYCAAMAQVAARLRGCPNVLGYETMNEPSHGLIGHGHLDTVEGLVKLGDCPSPYQSMLLGAGFPQEVPVIDVRIFGHVRTGKRLLNPRGTRLWRDGADCIWRRHGVWDVGPDGEPRLLQPEYFRTAGGRTVDFSRDYYQPFANRFARAIRAEHRDAVIFLQTEVGLRPPRWGADDAPRIAWAPHWYDPVTIVLKRYYGLLAYDVHTRRLVLGRRAIRRSVASQLAEFRRQAQEYLNGAPTILGETGVPFDLGDRRAYHTGDFREQIAAVDRTMSGIESNLLSSCWWAYTPDNDNTHGDQWNGEDFSIFSRDQQQDPADPSSGGRALEALVRPYGRAIAGEPREMSFDRRRGRFTLTYRHDERVAAPTEVFVPAFQYPHGYQVSVTDGSYAVDREQQLVAYRHSAERLVHTIEIERR
jgi:hypothetical protein